MTDTPLKAYLSERGKSAEKFAVENQLNPWSVRYWVRGDKEPSLNSQVLIEQATGGVVTPAAWLEWRLSNRSKQAA